MIRWADCSQVWSALLYENSIHQMMELVDADGVYATVMVDDGLGRSSD